jgi:hypothetical protein
LSRRAVSNDIYAPGQLPSALRLRGK